MSFRPYLDKEIYNRHLDGHATETHQMPNIFCSYIDSVLESENIKQLKKELRAVFVDLESNENSEEENQLKFLDDILRAM